MAGSVFLELAEIFRPNPHQLGFHARTLRANQEIGDGDPIAFEQVVLDQLRWRQHHAARPRDDHESVEQSGDFAVVRRRRGVAVRLDLQFHFRHAIS